VSSYLRVVTETGDYLDMYDYVIVTHIPAFYKVNLYNELSKKLNIYVIFIAENTIEQRANDFNVTKGLKFPHSFLNKGSFQNRNLKVSISALKSVLGSVKYKRLLIPGWDLPEFWYLVLSHRKSQNFLALESTAIESCHNGIKGWIKRFFLNRVGSVLASGKEHIHLLNNLRFKGQIITTGGVGIINKPLFDRQKKQYEKKFLFIGRLSEVKNIDLLVDVFNSLPDYELTIIGDGPLYNSLNMSVKTNIHFLSKVDNKALVDSFLSHDILILPSLSEPWGLVIEEALYFGVPVIASRNCGASELIMDGLNGFIFDPFDKEQLLSIIQSINVDKYSELLSGVEKFSINEKDNKQVAAYTSAILNFD